MTFRLSVWTVTALAMAAGALSSDPPEMCDPSPESWSFSTRWYLALNATKWA